MKHLLALLVPIVLALVLVGCQLAPPREPAEIEAGLRCTVGAAVAEGLRAESVRRKVPRSAVVLVRDELRSSVIPALEGKHELSVAVARVVVSALDYRLTQRGAPPLSELTRGASETIAGYLRGPDPGEMLSPGARAALLGFLRGLADGLDGGLKHYRPPTDTDEHRSAVIRADPCRSVPELRCAGLPLALLGLDPGWLSVIAWVVGLGGAAAGVAGWKWAAAARALARMLIDGVEVGAKRSGDKATKEAIEDLARRSGQLEDLDGWLDKIGYLNRTKKVRGNL